VDVWDEATGSRLVGDYVGGHIAAFSADGKCAVTRALRKPNVATIFYIPPSTDLENIALKTPPT
jgi:hypothetical protein